MTQILDIMHFLFGLLLMKSLMENVSNYDSFEKISLMENVSNYDRFIDVMPRLYKEV